MVINGDKMHGAIKGGRLSVDLRDIDVLLPVHLRVLVVGEEPSHLLVVWLGLECEGLDVLGVLEEALGETFPELG